MLDPEDKSNSALLECWVYEAARLFRDKLASDDNIHKFDSILKSALHADWSSNAADKLDRIYYVTAADSGYSPGSPMSKFGRQLGNLGATDWESVVENILTSR